MSLAFMQLTGTVHPPGQPIPQLPRSLPPWGTFRFVSNGIPKLCVADPDWIQHTAYMSHESKLASSRRQFPQNPRILLKLPLPVPAVVKHANNKLMVEAFMLPTIGCNLGGGGGGGGGVLSQMGRAEHDIIGRMLLYACRRRRYGCGASRPANFSMEINVTCNRRNVSPSRSLLRVIPETSEMRH